MAAMELAGKILPIVQAGHPALRKPAEAVSKEYLSSAECQQLIADMIVTMRDAPGVGIAAPQVGVTLQIFVAEDRSEAMAMDMLREAKGRVDFGLRVFVNPVLTILESETQTEFFEGCLSVVGYQGRVKRARKVRITSWNEKGEDITWETSDWPARILQHEYDHLQGTLYVDRMDPTSFTAKEHMPAAIQQQLKSIS